MYFNNTAGAKNVPKYREETGGANPFNGFTTQVDWTQVEVTPETNGQSCETGNAVPTMATPYCVDVDAVPC